MFENKLNTITLSGKEYPMKCSILVLEKIQDKYGTCLLYTSPSPRD